MDDRTEQALRQKLDSANFQRLAAIENPALHRFVAEAVELCEPDSVVVCTDSDEDIAMVRRMAIENSEETPLATEGHTFHFDGFADNQHHDQGRDKENTRYLVSPGTDLGGRLNQIDKQEGLSEVREFLAGSMRGRTALVRFFCLGPVDSAFSVSGVQVTDSAYVAHSEDLLYRSGYAQFKRLGDSEDFFRVLHSAGRLEHNVSADMDKRRIYIALDEQIVYSVNTQYAGNTVGFKKLSLRLAISKADREGWLAEHMLVVGIHGPGERVTYFTGAFPSACGKTSTAMLPGETIVGDDLAYLRAIDGELRAVNVEEGVFGIIRDVNPQDDPVIWQALQSPGEVIFSNVLVADGVPYWLGMEQATPGEGRNYSGEWHEGKTDSAGKEITLAHRNARYTVRQERLPNCDPHLQDPSGVKVSGVIYGGRDSDTCVPVEQAFDWAHGIITKAASLESETTAATLGAEGVRVFNPMSNIDFVAIPLGRYIENNLRIVEQLAKEPLIFGVNYFLKGADGAYLNAMEDKRVWLKWMELRVHGDVDAIERPTGLIPHYEDLQRLFRECLGRDYTRAAYDEQFELRVDKSLAKLDRVEAIYRESVPDAPEILYQIIEAQRQRLLAAR